jgi:hypothetical protein
VRNLLRPVRERNAQSDNRSTRRVVRADQAWSDGRHAGAFLSSWITGPITGEMFTKITHISSMSERFVGDGRLRLSGRSGAPIVAE